MGNTSNLMKYLLYSRKFLPPFRRLELWVPSKKVDGALCYRMAQCASKSGGARLLVSISSYHPGYSETTGWHLARNLTRKPARKDTCFLSFYYPSCQAGSQPPPSQAGAGRLWQELNGVQEAASFQTTLTMGPGSFKTRSIGVTKANELLDFKGENQNLERLLIES